MKEFERHLKAELLDLATTMFERDLGLDRRAARAEAQAFVRTEVEVGVVLNLTRVIDILKWSLAEETP